MMRTRWMLFAVAVLFALSSLAGYAADLPLIGEKAPAFEANTTQGQIVFPDDYQGKWVILFSHPADFTPVCTTEFMTFASMHDQFREMNCELIGLSIDSNYSHIAWLRKIQDLEFKGMEDLEVTFPVIEGVDMEVANMYGMIQPGESSVHAVRAVFFIDPDATVRALMYYPASTGRNFHEIMRTLVALQAADKHNVATPADWQPGDDVIVPPPGSCGTAESRMQGAGDDYYCLDWFLCLKELPKKKLDLPRGEW